jgi:DNA-binding GntR family transcriptional regulator
MNTIYINKKEKMPLYLQIQDSIRSAILKGELRNGDPLPYEEDISNFYHISRQVVRQAYGELEKEGYLVRIRRKGTYVHLKPRLDGTRAELTDLKKLIERKAYRYSRQLLLVESIFLKNERFPFCFKEHYNFAYRLVYAHYADNYPMVFSEVFIPGLYALSSAQLKDENFNLEKLFELKQIKVSDVIFGLHPKKASNIEALSLNLKQHSILSEFSLNYMTEDEKTVAYERLLADGESFIIASKGIL